MACSFSSSLRFILTVGFLSWSSSAHAEFSMSAMILDFLPGTTTHKDIEIRSLDDQKQYIATEIYKINNPGGKNQQQVLVTNMQKSGLIVSPAKMVLPAKVTKLMRFIMLTPPTDQDQIYRVTIKPVVNELDNKEERLPLNC
ncbi:MAG: hypothetical protein IPP74_00025 [Alphaproteobacteria bacterium]|nr:hypothetical protein [Alphaproteobacteria bacterium]